MAKRKSRAARLAEAEDLVAQARGIVEELKDEMDSWRDNYPENLQGTDKYAEIEAACDALEELGSHLEDADFGSVEFPGAF